MPVTPPRPTRPYAGNTPTASRVIQQQKKGIEQLFARIEQGMRDNWGQLEDVVLNRELNNALAAWQKEGVGKIATARLIAANVGDEARKFTLLSYPEKTYMDLALAYIYPYHFWYTRTYMNWMKRIVQNPQVIAGYAKYREALAKIHAGAPEWWKYQINTNELLGLDSENPLFFNLEATLNPLNGLTGVDFNDKSKRVNWWTNTLDDLGKFGPSTWTPFSLAAAVALYKQGEQEAASMWGSRLIPQTATLKSITALMNIGEPGGVEIDPMVLFFSGGMDPYERKRVGRAMWRLVEDGTIDAATALDATNTQSGPAWDMAKELSTDTRAWGQLASFFLGVGFKSRNITDIQIDRFYNDFYKTMGLYNTLSPQEVKLRFDALREQYPFMDTVLLSRKAGIERDRAFSYNVLGRIPPGQKNELSEAVGIDPRLIDKFYADKGDLEGWAQTDADKFLAGIVDLGAILNVPDNATRREWTAASNAYNILAGRMEEIWGKEITAKIDRFYEFEDDYEGKDAFIAANPDVTQAMDWRSATIMNDPLLAAYYAGISTVENFYKGNMRKTLTDEFGAGIHDTWDEYWDIKNSGGKYSDFWKKHPELERYMEVKARYEEIIARQITESVKALPEGKAPPLRDAAPESIGEQDLYKQITQPVVTPYDFTWADWQEQLSPQVSNLILDYLLTGDDLPRAAENQLDALAEELDLPSGSLILELIEDAVR
jgi:hypothetical protein